MTHIRWNWGWVWVFVFFWCHGFMGAVETVGFLSRAATTALLTGFFGFYVWLALKNEESLQDSLAFTAGGTGLWLGYLAVLGTLSAGELFYPLSGDQLSHAYYSHIHALKGGRKLVEFSPALLDLPVKAWAQGVSLVLLFSAGVFILVTRHLGRGFKLIFLVGLFVICRLSVWKVGGGNYDVHPAFRLFPLWLSSTLFGLNPFAFRLPQFLALVTAMCFCARRVESHTGSRWLGWTVGLAMGTVPVFWHVGTLVEFSIWSSVLAACFFVELLTFKEGETPHWVRWMSLFVVISLVRQPAFIGIGALGLFALLAGPQVFWRSKALYALPVLLPTLWNALSRKTPALATSSELKGFALVLHALSTGRITESLTTSLSLVWIGVGLIGFILLWRRPKAALSLSLFGALSIFIFYSIDPSLWGLGRYQAECFMPFVALGVIAGTLLLNRSLSHSRWVLPILLGVLAFYNGAEFFSLPTKTRPVDIRKLAADNRNSPVLSELHYRYDEAFRSAQNAGLADKTVLLGVGYGAMSQIIYGYSMRDWLAAFQVEQEIVLAKGRRGITSLNTFSSADIADNPEIKILLISDAVPHPQETQLTFFTGLKASGFRHWKTFQDSRYHSTIIAMIRD